MSDAVEDPSINQQNDLSLRDIADAWSREPKALSSDRILEMLVAALFRREFSGKSDAADAIVNNLDFLLVTLVDIGGLPGPQGVSATIPDPPPPARLHPNLAELYRAKVADLHLALADPNLRIEAIEIIRTLIERVDVRPAEGKEIEIELTGDIVSMLGLGLDASPDHKKTAPKGAAALAMYQSSVKVPART